MSLDDVHDLPLFSHANKREAQLIREVGRLKQELREVRLSLESIQREESKRGRLVCNGIKVRRTMPEDGSAERIAFPSEFRTGRVERDVRAVMHWKSRGREESHFHDLASKIYRQSLKAGLSEEAARDEASAFEACLHARLADVKAKRR